jgi:hypothetical protein
MIYEFLEKWKDAEKGYIAATDMFDHTLCPTEALSERGA